MVVTPRAGDVYQPSGRKRAVIADIPVAVSELQHAVNGVIVGGETIEWSRSRVRRIAKDRGLNLMTIADPPGQLGVIAVCIGP